MTERIRTGRKGFTGSTGCEGSTGRNESLLAESTKDFHYSQNDAEDLKKVFTPYYSQHHRIYHTTRHIVEMLQAAEAVCGNRTNNPWSLTIRTLPRHVVLAILAHDAVYVPRSPEGANENQSALLLRCLYDLNLLPSITTHTDIPKAQELIRLTADYMNNRKAQYTFDQALILNCDLYTLASPSFDAFIVRQQCVAEEFFAPISEQANFLCSLVDSREKIFIDDWDGITDDQKELMTMWERVAQANIKKLLFRIECGMLK